MAAAAKPRPKSSAKLNPPCKQNWDEKEAVSERRASRPAKAAPPPAPPSRRRRRDDDEDDFDEERPARSRRKPQKSNVGVLIALGIGGALVLMAAVIGVWFLTRPAQEPVVVQADPPAEQAPLPKPVEQPQQIQPQQIVAQPAKKEEPEPTKPTVAPVEVAAIDASSPFSFLASRPTSSRGMSGADVYQRLLKSCVCILAEGSQGSGSLVNAQDRLVITNYHVVRSENVQKVKAGAGPLVVQGQIDASSPPDRFRGTRCRIYQFVMLQGEKFSIDMLSTQFDTLLRLEDSRGTPLAEDDDGAGGLNARIVFTAPKDDTYRIVATSYKNETGTYILRITPISVANQPTRDNAQSNDTVYVFFPKISNGQVVTDAKSYINDVVANKQKYQAKVLFADQAKDLAIVQLNQLPPGVEALPLAKSSAPPGASVHSVGNPGASDSFWVYTSGTVRTNPYRKQWRSSAGAGTILQHDVMIIETQSPTNPGDSGGPLVNEAGELIAVTQGAVIKANAVNLFVDVSEVKNVLTAKGFKWAEGSGRGTRTARRDMTADDVIKLMDLLENRDSKIRFQAASYLGECGATARTAVSTLGRAMKDTDSDVRRAVAIALGEIGADASSALAALAAALTDSDRSVRVESLRAISRIGPKSFIAGDLAKSISDIDSEVQENALVALAKLGPDAATALPAVCTLLEGPEGRMRGLAWNVVKQMGNAAAGATETLQKVIVDPSCEPNRKVEILAMLARSGKLTDKVGEAMIPELIRGLSEEGGMDAMTSLKTLEQLGKQGKGAVRKIEVVYRNGKSRDVQIQALKTLAAIGEAAESAVPALVLDLKDQGLRRRDDVVYSQIGTTLTKIGKPAVKPLLKVALYDPDPFYRGHAIQIIGNMGKDVKDVAYEPLSIHLRNRENNAQVRAVLTTAIENLK